MMRFLTASVIVLAFSVSGCSDDSTAGGSQVSGSDSADMNGETATEITDSDSDTDTETTTDTGSDTSTDSVTYALRTEFGSVDTLEVVTESIFAIWWDPKFDHTADAPAMFEQLERIRRDCLDNLGMRDPPNPENGYYYNVYIHHGADDLFPQGWGNGQGTDMYGMPFLTLPDGAHRDVGNIYHEGFHIFQYQANAPGFAYAGDSQWYIEATAQWYQSTNLPADDSAFVEAGAIAANPQLTLWHSFGNEAPGDAPSTNWLYGVRQYGMHTYLFYLTSQAGVNPDLITNGFYSGTTQSPQQYHFENIGPELRGYFADWAAHNTAGFDYLTPGQVERAQYEVDALVELQDISDWLHPYVAVYQDEGTSGAWVRPEPVMLARGWAYNVIKVNNTDTATYTWTFEGDATGSEGAMAHFEIRAVVMGENGPRYTTVTMDEDLTSTATLNVEASDSEVYFVIASVPEHFSGNQTYGYQYKLVRE